MIHVLADQARNSRTATEKRTKTHPATASSAPEGCELVPGRSR